jgi:hypothetical protein
VADIYHQALKGAIVVAVLNKWRDDKPFALQDIMVIQPPLDAKEEKKTNEQAPNAQ